MANPRGRRGEAAEPPEEAAAAAAAAAAAEGYERQRQERIRENNAKLQSLGLAKLSASVQSPDAERREGRKSTSVRRRRGWDEEEYRPSEESSSEEEERKGKRKGCSSSGSVSRRTPKMKEKNKDFAHQGSARKKLFSGGFTSEDIGNDDSDDVALQKALALSLGETLEDSDPLLRSASSPSTCVKFLENSKRRKGKHPEVDQRGKQRKGNVRRIQITEDEAIGYFFMFDDAGKGKITLGDLLKMANAHDFSWSDKEMVDMIRCFDSDGDGKLTFDDFHTILNRCNILQDSNVLDV